MAAWDADADALIAQGWGSHRRGDIPDDWMTRRGPDSAWNRQRGTRPKRRVKRRSYAELRAEREARFHYFTPEARIPLGLDS